MKQIGIDLKTKAGAIRFLESQGFKVSRTKFERAIVRGYVTPLAGGGFDAANLLDYGKVRLLHPQYEPGGESISTEEVLKLKFQKMKVDLDLNKAKTSREKIREKVEKGLFIERSKHEAALAGRMALFKDAVEVFGMKAGEIMVERFNMPMALLPVYKDWWDEATADWLNAFVPGKEQIVDVNLDEITPGLLSAGKRATGQVTEKNLKETPDDRYARRRKKS